jgi:hypothetical protein
MTTVPRGSSSELSRRPTARISCSDSRDSQRNRPPRAGLRASRQKFFCTSRPACLMLRRGEAGARTQACANRARRRHGRRPSCKKRRFHRDFLKRHSHCVRRRRDRAAPRALVRGTRGNAQHLVCRHALAHSNARKHWFFCRTVVIRMQCSRSPRALLRHRHSLMARRAAWRRSERRRQKRPRRRAPERPSAGRRSKHAPLPSLRLRTSMTASHGPA